MKSIFRRYRRAAVLLAILIAAPPIIAGERLSAPSHHAVNLPPGDFGLENLQLRDDLGRKVAAWFHKGTPGRGIVLLTHGIHSDRSQMLSRSQFLKEQGYGVLLIDLASHGESDGERISFGLGESKSVDAGFDYLKQQFPQEKIAGIGVSLGGAALVFAKRAKDFDALILESMFPTIREATEDRLEIQLGVAGRSLAPLLLWQIPLRLGVSIDDIAPIDRVAKLHVPILIASGSDDVHTKLAETERIFQVANSPKELWIVQGAWHVDFHYFYKDVYEERILKFLNSYLQNPQPQKE